MIDRSPTDNVGFVGETGIVVLRQLHSDERNLTDEGDRPCTACPAAGDGADAASMDRVKAFLRRNESAPAAA